MMWISSFSQSDIFATGFLPSEFPKCMQRTETKSLIKDLLVWIHINLNFTFLSLMWIMFSQNKMHKALEGELSISYSVSVTPTALRSPTWHTHIIDTPTPAWTPNPRPHRQYMNLRSVRRSKKCNHIWYMSLNCKWLAVIFITWIGWIKSNP